MVFYEELVLSENERIRIFSIYNVLANTTTETTDGLTTRVLEKINLK